jgi:hypothetical protein
LVDDLSSDSIKLTGRWIIQKVSGTVMENYFESEYERGKASENDNGDPQAQFARSVVEGKVRLKIDKQGNILKFKVKPKRRVPRGPYGPTPEDIWITPVGGFLPKKPVKIGSEWKSTVKIYDSYQNRFKKYKLVSLLKKIEKVEGRKCAVIVSKGNFKKKGKARFTIWFDLSEGMIIKEKGKWKITRSIAMGPMGKKNVSSAREYESKWEKVKEREK